MLKQVPVFRVAVVSVLALTICGVNVIAEESLGVTEGEKEASSGENKTSSSDNWVENLSWNLLGYATMIIPAAFIIRMLKNSNFNERSGKFFCELHTCSELKIPCISLKRSCYRQWIF